MGELRRGQRFCMGGDWMTVLAFLEEPNTGLCVVEVESRGWSFTVPTALVRAAVRNADAGGESRG